MRREVSRLLAVFREAIGRGLREGEAIDWARAHLDGARSLVEAVGVTAARASAAELLDTLLNRRQEPASRHAAAHAFGGLWDEVDLRALLPRALQVLPSVLGDASEFTELRHAVALTLQRMAFNAREARETETLALMADALRAPLTAVAKDPSCPSDLREATRALARAIHAERDDRRRRR